MEQILQDAYDLHIHCGPDIIPRSVTGLEMAKRALACGMRGFAIKSHYTDTCQQAALIRALQPACNAIGTLTLNASVGGINPMAVETAGRLGARIVWCPTFDSDSQQKYYLRELPQYIAMQKKLLGLGMPAASYRLTGEDGALTAEIKDVLTLVQEFDMVLGTGHISHAETFALARETHKRNFKKLLITHADWEFTKYSVEEQLELVTLGAVIEHSYTSPAGGHVPWEEVFYQIRRIGPEHIILTTDLGQANNEYPDIGLQKYAQKLLSSGFDDSALKLMIVHNPTNLIE